MPHNYYTGEKAELKIDGKVHELPVIVGTEGEKAIDIRSLRAQTGYVAFDSGYANTGSCISNITYLDGERGVLSYRGYDIAELAENCTFVEVAYLLDHGSLPTRDELNEFSQMLNDFAMIHEDMIRFFDSYPPKSPPMAILSSMVNSLCSFYPEMTENPLENIDRMSARLVSKVRTIAAFSYKKSLGHPVVYPRHDLSYCANFLNMMFDSPVRPYEINHKVVAALNKLLILHGDHEQNCSTSTVRMVGSARVNLYASVSAGISALWGPLHGGANQAVMEMLESIHESGGDYRQYVERAKDPKDPFRLAGFGHRVYKTYDPRCRIIKQACDEVLEDLKFSDPLLDLAKELEEVALKDDYFVERNLYPNVDFYSGIIYRAIGIPTSMFTVMFALGRLPGWIAHWKEMWDDPAWRISRPRQVYVGPLSRPFVPIDQR
ncbi:citrate synthase [Desulfurivibrio alkaliphilus]|uniref:Citrate synthase n=1 Tax=Desulfurivibrio alkaliphilus (strain DSM 19089 / UNIQEM U267 / AHT2) TaxID=589865 RepID=D6Z473_DESAT|nr:citrate synthase [Desulfurivibrio alkaliphilus]ADH86348.1 citrate synthase I [Desulfurivibrio alkaliphilus AHT 2]